MYHETGYDLGRSKPVKEEWLQENAIGRHNFVEKKPPETVPSDALQEYVNRELLEKS